MVLAGFASRPAHGRRVIEMVASDMQAYLVPGWLGEVLLQWFGPNGERLTKVLYQSRHSELKDRCQGAVILVDFESDGSLECH